MGKPGRDRAPSSVTPGDSATRQEVCHGGPSTRSQSGGISPGPTRWPPGAEERLVPERSNLKPPTLYPTHPETVPKMNFFHLVSLAKQCKYPPAVFWGC